MRLVRSWPAEVPSGRAYVVDEIERLVISNYDYGTKLAELDDDVILLEWDLAVSREDLFHFAEHALEEPERVLAGSYVVYRDSRYASIWPDPDEDQLNLLTRWYRPAGMFGRIDPSADPDPDPSKPLSVAIHEAERGSRVVNGFGFGLIYLPRDLIRRCTEERAGRKLGDKEFSRWHFRNERRDARACWHVNPVHLHFNVPKLGA